MAKFFESLFSLKVLVAEIGESKTVIVPSDSSYRRKMKNRESNLTISAGHVTRDLSVKPVSSTCCLPIYLRGVLVYKL
jgi:hypothetical protein